MSVIRNRLRQVHAGQDGWALVTAIILLSIMMGSTLALAAYLDTQTQNTGRERVRESAFNLAEAALNQQVWGMGRPQMWPGAVGNAYPACNQASTSSFCPTPTQLKKFIPTPDADPGVTWDTRVIDNNDPAAACDTTGSTSNPYVSFYNDSVLKNSAYRYDCNKDGFVWVRAQATMRNRTRTLVALVRQEPQSEDFPRAAVLAGAMTFTNSGGNGQKTFIVPGTTTAGVVGVRCDPAGPNQPCLGYSYCYPDSGSCQYDSSTHTAISPWAVTPNYPTKPAIDADALQRFIDDAHSKGTYYTTCPTDLTGNPVVIDIHTACQVDAGNAVFNTQTKPGFVIILNADSSLQIAKNSIYWGILYHRNQPTAGLPGGSNGTLINLGPGCAQVLGGVIIDGPGRLVAGSCGDQITFVDSAYDNIKTIGAAGIIQNTWREIRGT